MFFSCKAAVEIHIEVFNALVLYIIVTWYRWAVDFRQTLCQIFTHQQLCSPPTISINRQPIMWKTSWENVKYMSVLLDTHLTSRMHMLDKLNQGYSGIAQLFPIINRKSRSKVDCMLLVLKTLIHPLLLYSCVVWSDTALTNIRKILVLRNSLLRISVNAERFISNRRLH